MYKVKAVLNCEYPFLNDDFIHLLKIIMFYSLLKAY